MQTFDSVINLSGKLREHNNAQVAKCGDSLQLYLLNLHLEKILKVFVVLGTCTNRQQPKYGHQPMYGQTTS